MFIDHVFAKTTSWKGSQQGLPRPGLLYEYVVAQNGVFVRAQRPGLAVQIPVIQSQQSIKGLKAANLVVNLPQRIPAQVLHYIILNSRDYLPLERLFYLEFNVEWILTVPDQSVSSSRCAPDNPYNESCRRAVIEVHSHNLMDAYFSEEDDLDETGFKIYVVLGRLDQERPQIAVRVGVYGYRAMVPANLVFSGLGLEGVDDVFSRIS